MATNGVNYSRSEITNEIQEHTSDEKCIEHFAQSIHSESFTVTEREFKLNIGFVLWVGVKCGKGILY